MFDDMDPQMKRYLMVQMLQQGGQQAPAQPANPSAAGAAMQGLAGGIDQYRRRKMMEMMFGGGAAPMPKFTYPSRTFDPVGGV